MLGSHQGVPQTPSVLSRKAWLEGECLHGKQIKSLLENLPLPQTKPQIQKRQRQALAARGQTAAWGGAACALDVALKCAPGCTFPGIRRGLCSPGRDLQGFQDRNAGAEVGRSVRAREGAWELTLLLQTGTSVEARFALAVHRVWREGGEAATWGEKGAGPESTLVFTQTLSSSSHSHSQNSRGACSVLPHALARIFCFVVSFRSINKCVIVNVKTHQSNNNGTKSKDYPSLLVTTE